MTPTKIDHEPDVARAEQYLDRLSPILVGKVLNVEQRAAIGTAIREEGLSVRQVVRAQLQEWANDPFLQISARDFIEQTMSISGERDGIDFNQPGNLAELIVRDGLPWSEILTHDTCVGADLEPADCGTGAPFASGVLATRAYLVSRAGRFNLTRAGNMMGAFLCEHYPMAEEFQPRLEREVLIPMFSADAPEMGEEGEEAPDEFGNGFACYSCHSQFGAHAQLFVRFAQDGLWHENATGVQDPESELGRSTNGLYASHFVNPEESGLPRSQVLGQEVDNLADAAKVLVQSPKFYECSSEKLIKYSLGLGPEVELPEDLLHEIAADIEASASDAPKYTDLLIESLGNLRVIEAATADFVSETDAQDDE